MHPHREGTIVLSPAAKPTRGKLCGRQPVRSREAMSDTLRVEIVERMKIRDLTPQCNNLDAGDVRDCVSGGLKGGLETAKKKG